MIPRCRTETIDGEKVVIPECWGTVHTGNLADCYCVEDDTLSERQLDQAWRIAEQAIDQIPKGKKRRAMANEVANFVRSLAKNIE